MKKHNVQVVPMQLKKISLLSVLVFSVSFAQAPVPTDPAAPVIETYGVPEVAPADGQAPIAVPAPEPVGEPQVANQVAPAPLPEAGGAIPAAAPVPEDGTIKGVDFSLSLGVYPVSYNNQTLGVGVPAETGRWFMGLKPGAGVSTKFKTGGGRTVSFGADYSFTLQEYYNKTTTKRDFSHEINGNVGIDWSPVVSTALPITFGYALKQGGDEAGDGGLSIDTSPGVKFKANKQVSFDAKYHVFYAEGFVDVPLSDVNTGDGVGNPIGNDDYYDGSYDFTGDTAYGFSNQGQTSLDGENVTPAYAIHRILLGSSFKPVDETSLGLTYGYQINSFNTDDSAEASGHFITPSVTQKLFKGNSIGLANELRFLKSKYAVLDNGAAKQSFRNRLRLTIEQEVTKNIKFDLFYRWQLAAANADNYEKKTHTHWFYSGLIFSL